MAKTKFLSKVLAVLMALSMLCSTGVFADYNSGLTAGDAAVTGEITITKLMLNDKLNLNAALEADLAKWASIDEGIKINLAGTTSAQTGTLTYLIAPVDTLEAVPLDVAAMEAKSLAIGATEFTGGAFDVTIEADKAKIVAGETYELRFAYSKTDIADVTDATALVYQRYIKTFDWAAATYKSTNTIKKAGIGDITLTIENNPLREAAYDLTNAQGQAQAKSPTVVRSHSLPGALISNTETSYTKGHVYEGQTSYTATSNMSAALADIGSKFRGGVLLGTNVDEVDSKFAQKTQNGNAAYRFKADGASGTVYYVSTTTLDAAGWTRVTASQSGYYPFGVGASTHSYFYVAGEGDQAATDESPAVYTGTFKLGKGGSSSNGPASWLKEDVALNASWYTPDGKLQIPSANLVDGEWQYGKGTTMDAAGYAANAYPYSMTEFLCFSSDSKRGRVFQGRRVDQVYTRDFADGEYVEIPYEEKSVDRAATYVVIQFDVPAAPLASATVTTTKSKYYSDALPMMDAATVALDAANPVISVPRGTETVSFTVADVNGVASEAVSVTMDEAKKVATAVIGEEEYEVTVQFAEPTLYNYKNNYSYDGDLRIALQYGDLSNVLINGKKTNAPDGKALSAQTFKNGAVKPALDANLIAIGTYANQGQAHMNNFKWKEVDSDDGMHFNVSAPATVYVLSVGAAKTGSENLDEAGYEINGTINGFPLYEKHFNAGDLVKIPTEPVTQAELDALNATTTNRKYIFVDDTNKDLYVEDRTDVKAGYHGTGKAVLFNVDENGNPVSAVKASTSNPDRPYHYCRGQSTIFYVVFDAPATLDTLSYTIGAADAQAIELAEGATEATIEVPYGTTDAITLAGTVTGTGSIETSDALVLSSANKSGTITATVKNGSGEAVATYTITFVWGAPEAAKLNWTSALALTGTPKAQDAAAVNTNLYAKGLYGLGEVSGTIELNPEETEVTLTVPYGVEAVKLNNGEKIDLLGAANHAATATVTVQEVEYTVNIAWAAYEYAAGMPLLYDLEYNYTDRTNIAGGGTWYYAVPSNLVLNADMDVVYGEGHLIGTDGNGKVTVEREEGEWFTAASQKKGNYATVNEGANINRHRISPHSFESFVANGDIDDKYAFNGATIIVTSYKDAATAVSPRFNFKSAVNGYVIVAGYQAQDLGDGWTRLEGNKIQTTTANTGAQGTALGKPPEGHTNPATTFGEDAASFGYVYVKAVNAGDPVSVAYTKASSENPPIVMVVTEDMLNVRPTAPTLLASLSYTTELVNADALLSGTANARKNGFYQPTLVTKAETVAVAEDATTVNVTVPYGSEIVKLAGVDTYEGAVEFDAINLINNNGKATLTKTVGEATYTINVAWDAFGTADAEKNLVYDVAYGVKELATGSVYNTIPTKLVLAEKRIYPDTKDGYENNAAEPKLKAGKWSPEIQTNATNSTVKGENGNGPVTRGRLGVGSFAPWVEAGIITANGVVGTPLVKGEEETDAEFDARVDAIAYAAMNGAGLFVADYNAYTTVPTADYAYKFKVAQDSIIYVQTNSTNIGEGWTRFGTDTYLGLYGGSNTYYYYLGEDGTYTKAGKEGSFGYSNQGARVFYRYAKAGEEVSLKPASVNKNISPLVFVRPLDFSAIPAPVLASASYKIGDGEATAIEFNEANKASVEVPWGTDADISVAAVVEGLGGATVSGPINLATADGNTADVTITVTPTLGGDDVTYTVTFAWGAAPVVEAVTYSTAATIYKVATVTDVEVAQETQDITVPWGTASVTVSYKMENADAVALKAVSLLNGAATVEVPLPTGAITLNFAWGNAPAGQYIIGLTKTANNWRDRMFVSFGDLDNAHVAGNSGYAPTGSAFFADGDVYSFRVPEGLAKRGEVAVIADAGANYGLSHMQHSSFPYLYDATYSVGTEAANSWLTFTVAKDGMLYFAPASFDGVWEAGEALGWTVAPFGMEWAAAHRKLYQKKVSAGEVVYFPNDVVDQAEIDAKNATLNGYNYVQVTQEDIDAMSAAVKAENAEYFVGGVIVGDYIAKYDDDFLAAGEGVGANYAGFRVTEIKGKEVQFNHYGRADTYVLFAVADANVAEELKAPKYTGATIVAADESIELSASKAIYAEDAGEITFELKETAYATLEGNVLTANRDAWVEGAAVEVIVKQTIGETVLTSTAVITIGAVDASKYGYLTIAEPEGNGVIEGYVGEELVLYGAVDAMEFGIGTTVKLVATPVGDYEFKYWALVDANGKETVYTDKAEVAVSVPYGITLKPVFAAVAEGAYTVTFKGYQGAIIASYSTASVDVVEVPEALKVFGYDFVEYKAQNASWVDTYEEGDTIAKELIDRDLVFIAQYEQKAEMVYTVAVVGGTVNGAESAEFKYNTPVTVVAGEAEEGMKFSHWVDEADQVLSYNAEFTFYMAAANRTVKAVFVAEDAVVSQAPVVTMTVTTIDGAAAEPVYGLFAERRVPEEYTVVESGIVYGYAGNKYGLTEESESVTLENYTSKSTSKYQNNNGQYTVQAKMTLERQAKGGNWYASTYLMYRDTDGSTKTIYSPKALIWEYPVVAE